MVFPAVMFGCEGWTVRKAEHGRIDAFGLWCWRRLLRVPWTARRSSLQPVHPKGDQSWVVIWRTDAEAATPMLLPPHAKIWLIGKDLDAGRDWGQEEKGMAEDKMAWWHHRLDAHGFGWTLGVGDRKGGQEFCDSWGHNAHGFEWTLGVGDGQGGLAFCDSWGRKELDTTERLNWTELNGLLVFPIFFN